VRSIRLGATHRLWRLEAEQPEADEKVDRRVAGEHQPDAYATPRRCPAPKSPGPGSSACGTLALNTTGLDCPAPKPSPLDGDSPMYRPRQLVDLATPITDTALMVHGFKALPQVARR
jgi:hypothetical protein